MDTMSEAATKKRTVQKTLSDAFISVSGGNAGVGEKEVFGDADSVEFCALRDLGDENSFECDELGSTCEGCVNSQRETPRWMSEFRGLGVEEEGDGNMNGKEDRQRFRG